MIKCVTNIIFVITCLSNVFNGATCYMSTHKFHAEDFNVVDYAMVLLSFTCNPTLHNHCKLKQRFISEHCVI